MNHPMEQEAERRKARLQALRLPRDEAGARGADSLQAVNQALTLRNYRQVLERETRLTARRPPRPAEGEEGDGRGGAGDPAQDTIEDSVRGVVERTLAERQEDIEGGELDIAAIAPKRANWDLKRDLQKRLDELKRVNEIAVADIIRRRVQASGSTADLAAAVGAHAQSAGE
ncbi:hypothetical protein H4R18_002970 [Coemansia javaensis]|uniref:mRNA splicing factor n=1 Tax=Coemansia javaensis TaxID=2761396 RepID=A0A9W8HG42_9FUNG|nr:hypothetical protein H4R18_002970 [Coemansia javaensis]